MHTEAEPDDIREEFNLTAKKLTDANENTGNSIYGYTFATPTVTKKSQIDKDYDNIYNFCLDDDFVSYMPLENSNWQYDRYGHTFFGSAAEMYKESALENPAIVIDTNHSNPGKKFKQQIRITNEVMQNRRFDKDFKKIIKGFMIESFLEEGNQARDEVFGKSITDPCLGWEDTERLLFDIAEQA
jgi:hypothetical protein